MTAISDRAFHWIMGALFLGSTFLDQGMRALTSTWNPPEASLVTMVIGLVWIGRWSWWQQHQAERRERVLHDRIDRLERLTRALEDELREHVRRPLP